ncbi:MAG: type II secretion system F family protein [Candidatus Pacebacteria bacterium]|nr:type II secretion system F family protein [Candidatus Paceibacterota bacterium]
MELKYQAKNNAGEIVEGVIDAPSEDNAISILHDKQLVVLSLEVIKKDILSRDLTQIFSRITTKDVVVFTRQLSTLIEADMPLAEGLRTLAQQSEKPALRKVIMEVAQGVEGGSSLSNALGLHPKIFTNFYIKLVQSGEISGKLQGSLMYLADYLERSQEINSKIKGALTYPAFVVSAMILVFLIMGVYVLPQLLLVFKDSGIKELPLTTKLLISSTDFLNNYIYYILTMLILGGFFIFRFLSKPAGKAWRDNFLVNMPSLGKVVQNLYLARIAESLSTLIKSGLPILDALKISSDLVGNENYRKILMDSEGNVRSGGTISEILSQHKEMPPLFSSMVAIGERTGKLDYMLEHISKFYKSESETAISSITTLIEPILILVLGFAVAVLVSAILLPMYSIVG